MKGELWRGANLQKKLHLRFPLQNDELIRKPLNKKVEFLLMYRKSAIKSHEEKKNRNKV